jgi:hypothetical protein
MIRKGSITPPLAVGRGIIMRRAEAVYDLAGYFSAIYLSRR